jgi:hypothetical protein
MKTTYYPLYLLEKNTFYKAKDKKIMDIPTSFVNIIFNLTKILNTTMVRNVKGMLGQTLNHSVSSSVTLIQCHIL